MRGISVSRRHSLTDSYQLCNSLTMLCLYNHHARGCVDW